MTGRYRFAAGSLQGHRSGPNRSTDPVRAPNHDMESPMNCRTISAATSHHALRIAAITALITITAFTASASAAATPTSTRILRKEITIDAALADVWRAWTTERGLAPVAGNCRVELRIGGPYEWFLMGEPDEFGLRGSEGSQVLAFLPHEVLAFDWTFPPSIPTLRGAGAKTQVVVQFEELEAGPGADTVRIRFAQHGWQEGEDWDQGYAYFDQAWTWVLESMKKQLESP